MKDTSATHTALNELSDGELIRRTQNGDTQAFNPLIRKYQRRIYNLIYQRVRDREAAEDVCQEVFLKAWQALPNFKGESAFYSWLYRIAVNCSIDALRKRNREIVLAFEELPQGMDDVLQIPQMYPSPCEILERRNSSRLSVKPRVNCHVDNTVSFSCAIRKNSQ